MPAQSCLSVRALSADTAFMETEYQAKIIQVFDHAVNLWVAQYGRLYCLLTQQRDNAPNSCRLELAYFSGLFQPGADVRFHQQSLIIGENIEIDFRQCQRWQMEKLHITPQQFSHIAWRQIAGFISNSCIHSTSLFYYRGENIFYRETSRCLQYQRTVLLNALRYGIDIQSALLPLIGLGIGLTPSGDDYLLGLSSILLIDGHPAQKYRHHFLDVLSKAKSRTTLLSVTSLQHAFNQHYRQVIQVFIHAIINSNHQKIHTAIKKIEEIGSSSGYDILCGMADACDLSQYLGENHVN